MGENLAQVDLAGSPVAGCLPVRKLSLELHLAFLKTCPPDSARTGLETQPHPDTPDTASSASWRQRAGDRGTSCSRV